MSRSIRDIKDATTDSSGSGCVEERAKEAASGGHDGIIEY